MHRYHDLILLGNGPSMTGCPFDTETWAAISVLGFEGWEDKPYSKVFVVDKPSLKNLEAAQARNIPIVGIERYKYITECYPRSGIHRMFGAVGVWNVMSYMLAMALYRGYRNLLLYGVDQGPELQYQGGRPFTTYWLGVATGMGVKWELAPRCTLFRYSL